MKKYLLIVLALTIFVIAPVMADVTLSGAFRIWAIWDVASDEGHYLSRFDRTRLYFNSKIDDYNTFAMEVRGSRHREVGNTGRAATFVDQDTTTFEHFDMSYGGRYEGGNTNGREGFGQSDYGFLTFYIHSVVLTTDWAKYFDFADVVGLKSQVGYNAWGGFSKLSYTIWGVGSQNLMLQRDMGAKILFDIQGIVKPYFAKDFYAYDNFKGGVFEAGKPADVSLPGSSYIIGTGVDFAPVWVEAYFIQDGRAEYARAFDAEAEFAMEVADGMKLKVGGVVDMRNQSPRSYHSWNTKKTDAKAYVPKADDWKLSTYKVLAAFNAYGADLGVAFMGGDADFKRTGMLGLSVAYDVTKYFGLAAGTKLAIGDFKDYHCYGETFLGAEFSVNVKPGKVRYDLGYLILNEDARGWYSADSWALGNAGYASIGGDQTGARSRYFGGDSRKSDGSMVNAFSGGIFFSANASF